MCLDMCLGSKHIFTLLYCTLDNVFFFFPSILQMDAKRQILRENVDVLYLTQGVILGVNVQ